MLHLPRFVLLFSPLTVIISMFWHTLISTFNEFCDSFHPILKISHWRANETCMQTQRYVNTQEYVAAVGNTYIRPQVSGADVRSITAAVKPGFHDLSEFEHAVIVSTQERGHSISEVCWGFSHTTIYECTVNIGNPVKHQISNIVAAGKDPARTGSTMTEENYSTWQKCNSSANCCSFQCRAINKCQLVNHSTKHYRYGLSELKVHSCTFADCTTQSFTPHLGPSTPKLECWWSETCCLVWRISVSNFIKQMDVYGYGDKLINPWTLHVSRRLFRPVETL